MRVLKRQAVTANPSLTEAPGGPPPTRVRYLVLVWLCAVAMIAYVQLCDVPMPAQTGDYGEEARHERCCPGEGDLPLAEFLAALPADITIGLEVPMISKAAAGIGVREALRSDLDLQAGGFTAVDPDYEHSLEEVLRPLTQDIKGLNYGFEMVKDLREQLTAMFFLNKLSLPAGVDIKIKKRFP